MLFAAAFAVRPLPQADDPLEPSLQNEVDHALARAAAWLAARPAETNAPPQGDFFKTNALPRAQIALRLVSAQRGEGWWAMPTNAAPTRLAVEILKGL